MPSNETLIGKILFLFFATLIAGARLAIVSAFWVIGFAKDLHRKYEASMKGMWLGRARAPLKSGRSIFIFGAPHAGKSTFLACLLYYIASEGRRTLRRDPLTNREGVVVIRELLMSMDQGKFPEQTEMGFWQDLKIEYNSGISDELRKFSFQEIAGETAILFDPTHERHQSISDELRKYLLNSNAVLIVASSTPESPVEKEAINDFLELLYRRKYNRPILFLLTKFDEINSIYENEVSAAKALYPAAVNILSKDEKSELLPFSVGLVSDGSFSKNGSATYLEPVIEWMEAI